MSRPLFAQINLAALAANLARARELAQGTQVLAVVKADAYGHGLTRVLPALEQADGLALLELDAAVALRERHYTRRILLLEGFFEERELTEIAQRRLAIVVHHADQVAMLEQAALTRPLEVFVKVNTGMNRLGLSVGDVAGVRERRGAAFDDASRARRRRRWAEGAARQVRVRMQRIAVPAFDRQFGRRRPLCGSGRRYRASGHHALRCDSVSLRVRPGVGAAAGDDAAVAADRCSRTEGKRERWLWRNLYRRAAASDRHNRMRIRRRLPASCAQWNSGPRLWDQGTNGRASVDGHAERRFDRSAGRASRKPGRVMGRRPARR